MVARLGRRTETERYVAALRESVDRLSRLIRELLDYGHANTADRAPGSVPEIVTDAIRACGPLAATKGVAIRHEAGSPLEPLVMDRARLARALESLIENAVHHSPPGGEVVVRTSALGAGDDGSAGGVEVRVEDQGDGFRAEDLPRVFEPFFTRRPGGTGLGLAIVERIVVDHGGSTEAGNRGDAGGRGAVVTVRLPRAAELDACSSEAHTGGRTHTIEPE